MTTLAQQLIAENQRTQATFLDLGNCGLTELPSELLNCTWLEDLNLGFWYYEEEKQRWKASKNRGEVNQISCLVGIERLKKLRILFFHHNRIKRIDPLIGLANLQILDFNHNLVSDVSPLSELTTLKSLTFVGNRVIDIAPLQLLVKLQRLNFERNQVSDIAPLQGLSNLQELNFGSNKVADIAPLQGLSNLQELYFGSNKISDIAPLSKLANLQKLYFGSNKISDIAPLQLLVKLQRLNFEGNQVADIAPLQGLSNLQELSFESNQVADIAPLIGLANLQILTFGSNGVSVITPLQGLVNLQILFFWSNKVADITPLEKLVNLQNLYFGSNKISDIAPLQLLVKLQRLSFEENQVADIAPLRGLANLKALNFESNQVADIDPLIGLANLQILAFGSNGVSVITPLSGLAELQELDFRSNKINDISPLQKLVNLQNLNFEANQVADIAPLRGMSNLQRLSFGSNQVTDITPLRGMSNLQRLSFGSNKVADISLSFLNSLPKLSELALFGNPLQDIPREVLGTFEHNNCLPALQDYFQSIAKKEFQKELNEAKLIIVGVGEVGKSELVDALSEPDYVFVKGRDTTPGIRIKNWTLKDCQRQAKSIDFRVNVWDFAGQEINYGTHQFFLTKNSVYVFVWETRRGIEESNQFAYWLSVIALLSENAPVLVVQNKTDIYTGEINQADWKSKFPNIIKFYETSCQNGSGIENLRADLKSQLLALPHTFEIWNKDRYAIREGLTESSENYLSHKKYLKICEERQLNKEQAGFLSQRLHDIGVLLHYPNDITLKDTVVLKPEWATQAAYLLLNSNLVVQGKFSTTDLEKIWAEEKFDEKHAFLLGLMKKFELVFQFQDSETYIVPERLPVEPPENQTFERFNTRTSDSQKHLRFEYYYDFMPKGIISHFICRMHELIKGELFWKYGIELQYENSEAIIISSEVNKQIRIEVVGKKADKLLAMIRLNFAAIHQKLKNPKLTEKVPCVCPDTCDFKNNPYLHDYQTLINFQTKGRRTRECEKSAEDIEIATLLDTKKVNQKYLLDLIDENKYPEFYQELDLLDISDHAISALRKDFVHDSGNSQYADRLKVWVGNYFRERRSR